MKQELQIIALLILAIVFISAVAQAQPNNITYQGKLNNTGTPSTNYDFEFRIYDSPTGGTLMGTKERLNVPVSNGIFSVQLDIAPLFYQSGEPFMEIRVRNAGAGSYTTLTPRQPIASVPYGIFSTKSTFADFLGGFGASSFLHNTASAQNANLSLVGNTYLNGNLAVGSGSNGSPLRLDVTGRSRFRQGPDPAGFWLYQNSPAADRAFVGMQDDNNVGFFGNNGAAWGLTMNTITGNVGIGTAPNDKLEVNGFMRVNQLSGGGTTQLCRNGANQLSLCGSSLRYKTNIAPFFPGLSFVRQLRPITFDWIQDGMRDVGFGAEDVARIDPLFVTYNDRGEVEGVKYDRIGVVAVNAIKEQQAEIDALRKTVERQSALNEQQQRELDTLQSLIARITTRRKSVLKKGGQTR